MLIIIRETEAMGYAPKWVYNTNGYDKAETLRSLEGIIDVYLPDFKYLEEQLAFELSDAKDYPEAASLALKEIFRQKGSTLITDNWGRAASGMIIRHLVLPGQVENSLKVLRFIAEELSPRIHISLMSQYYPVKRVKHHPFLFREITEAEYDLVKEEMERLGMHNGWIQDFGSGDHYRPDFNKDRPFDEK
jgi:putative pyruvate formate lyase activating enzyme